MADQDSLPVIIGVGEVVDRPSSPDLGLEPAALMAEALRRADRTRPADGSPGSIRWTS